MWRSLEVFVLFLCLVSAFTSRPVSPPRNVSLSWRNEFCATLTWAPPENLDPACEYKLQWDFKSSYLLSDILTDEVTMMRPGGISIETSCNDDKNTSEPVVISTASPALVRNFKCFYFNSTAPTLCSWLPQEHVPDLQLYYRSISMWDSEKLCSALDRLTTKCSNVYTDKHDGKTVCRLQNIVVTDTVYFLFNGTMNNTPVGTTFRINMVDHVKYPPLNWTMVPSGDHGDKLIISWTAPVAKAELSWTYEVSYTECNVKQDPKFAENRLSTELPINPDCKYNISVRAFLTDTKDEGTPVGDYKIYGEKKKGPPALIYIASIIPVVFAALAALALVCFRKHKEKIFPKVPEVPRDLLRDILNNNNPRAVGNLYVPAQEEEECKITLAIHPQEDSSSYEKQKL